GLTPTLTVKEVGPRVRRARKVLDSIPHVKDVVDGLPSGVSFAGAADPDAEEARRLDAMAEIADKVGTAYKPSCLSNCGNARFCRERAFCSGSPKLLGLGMERVLPGVQTLGRAEQLSRGATPTADEKPAAALLAAAG